MLLVHLLVMEKPLTPPAIQYIALMCSEWCLLVNRTLNYSLQTHSATSFSNVSRWHVHGINLKPWLLPKTLDISIAFFWFDFASLQFTKKATKIKIGNLIGQTAFLNAGAITVGPDDDKIVCGSINHQPKEPNPNCRISINTQKVALLPPPLIGRMCEDQQPMRESQ